MNITQKSKFKNSISVSAYSLTLEGDVPLQKAVEKGEFSLPEEDEWAEEMLTVKRALEDEGYLQYEISNFACEGSYCLHNLIYWSNGSYLGLGLGGVSHIGGRRWSNPKDLKRYLNKDLSPQWNENLPPHRKAAETAILMLRTRWGVPENHPICRDGHLRRSMEELCQRGLLERRNDAFVIPQRLLSVANEVLSRLVAEP
jgi:coproporphyrinogen III oxidase-like Fe-S oxidoreductase